MAEELITAYFQCLVQSELCSKGSLLKGDTLLFKVESNNCLWVQTYI